MFGQFSTRFQRNFNFCRLIFDILTYMIRILRFIRRFWIRIRSTRVRSAYFQSGNANRRKFFEDDLHNLDHIVQWNNLLLAIFFMVVVFMTVVKESIGFTVKKGNQVQRKLKNFFFQFRVQILDLRFLGVKELVQIVKISKVQTRLLSQRLLGLILKDAVQIIVWIGSDTTKIRNINKLCNFYFKRSFFIFLLTRINLPKPGVLFDVEEWQKQSSQGIKSKWGSNTCGAPSFRSTSPKPTAFSTFRSTKD